MLQLERRCSCFKKIKMSATYYNIFVGAQTGLFKGVNVPKKVFKNLNNVQTLDRQREICAMCWANEEESQYIIGLKNQLLNVYDTDREEITSTIDVSKGSGEIKGLSMLNNSLLTCLSSGLLRKWDDRLNPQLELNVGADIEKMRQNAQETNIIATGGKENNLKIWDLNNTKDPIFRAKNVPHDFLNLRVPVWEKDFQFVLDSKKIIVCTGHHQVRLYDPATPRRRPVIEMEFGEYPLTAIALPHNSNNVIVGNSRGYMVMLDLRKKVVVHRYKGFAGGIRCIQCHPSLPIVASCGLDRFLRVHDINTHKMLNKVYLKSALNCLLLRKDYRVEEESDNNLSAKERDESCNEDDEIANKIWDKMTVVSEKRKIERTNSSNAKCTIHSTARVFDNLKTV